MARADSEQLLLASAAGDVAALRALYDRHGGRLYGVALRITRQAALAADAVQEAFLQIWQNAGRFDPERGGAESWMLAMVRYRALDIVRRAPRDTKSLDGDEGLRDEVEAIPDPGALLNQNADSRALARCLGTLPADRRQIIIAAFVDGYSHSELADRFKTPLGTIKSWIRRSLDGLRLCLEG